jgi:type IV pilus assembly protein PilM
LPYLDLFIADKLSLPVAYFNPLRNVNLAPSLNRGDLQQSSCCTAELVGLALRETGSCPAEVTLDAPTLAARAAKRRKQPYYFGALVAWALLFVCLGLYYYQQTTVAQAVAAKLRSSAQDLGKQAPEIGKLADEQNALRQTLQSAVDLGVQRDAWAQVLAALNEKIPDGVWITELVPVSNPPAGGAAAPRPETGMDAPTNEINMLIINGLYHANTKTQTVDPARLGDFVNALADLPYFDIDKKNITATLTFTTLEADPSVFAEKFSMHLKLKTPIRLKPDVSKP